MDPDNIFGKCVWDCEHDVMDHGGGDMRLSEDFVDYLNGTDPSISCTSLEDSIYSHLTVFRAEKSRKNGTIERVF